MVKRGKEEIKVLTVGMEVGARRRIYFFLNFKIIFLRHNLLAVFSRRVCRMCLHAGQSEFAFATVLQQCVCAHNPHTVCVCACVKDWCPVGALVPSLSVCKISWRSHLHHQGMCPKKLYNTFPSQPGIFLLCLPWLPC